MDYFSELADILWFLIIMIPAAYLLFFYVTLPPIIAGIGIALYKHKISPFIWGLIISVVMAFGANIVYFLCCFELNIL